MVGSVVQRDLKIYNGITRENARIQRALDTCVNSGDKLLRDRAADYVIAELIALAALVRLNADLYVTCGAPTLASTLNSRRSLSTMISRCSSPIPAIMV